MKNTTINRDAGGGCRGWETMKYKQQSAENGGEELIKKQQIMATVAAAGEGKWTQQSTEHAERDGFERMRFNQGGGAH